MTLVPNRRRAMVVVILAGFALLAVFTVFVLRLSENAVRREARSRVGTTAALSARLVREQSLRVGEVVSSYATRLSNLPAPTDARLPPADRATLTRTLDALRTEVAGITSASFTDRLGRLVMSSPPSSFPAGSDLSGRDWYRGVQQHSPYLSRAYLSQGRGHRKVTVTAVRVLGPGDRLLGILLATETERTQTFTNAFGREFGTDVTVTDQAGTIVGATGHAGERLVSLAGDPLISRALRGRSGTAVRTINGQRTVSGYAPVGGTGWTVLAEVPTSAAYADVPRLRLAVLAGTGIAAFLLLWMVPLLVRSLGRAQAALGVQEAFQTDLLPLEMPAGVRSVYQASERRMLLGGDFIDAVPTPDGGLAVLVGDVCGHGPRAAALGSTLRAGWRTLASGGVGVDRLDLLDLLVEGERRDEDHFATVVCAEISPDGTRLRYALAGHPPALLLLPDGVVLLDEPRGAALGLGAPGRRPIGERDLPEGWALALYTDGLIEARPAPGEPRLGVAGLTAWATDQHGRPSARQLLETVTALAAHDAHQLDDDLALVLVDASVVRDPGVRTSGAPRSMGRA
jgi:serine phosphatase RsbU (regulator of sigma subunit)